MIIIRRRIFACKIIFLFHFLSALINVSTGYSQSLNSNQDAFKCEYLAKDAERRHGLPENILLSISRVESGFRKVDGVTRAWPWTLNAAGDSSYFQTKEAALDHLKEKTKKGTTNIDIGCMQLNYRWHKKFFNNLDDMMNPEKNVDYSARFLKKLYKRHGSWEKAVKYYHSSKSKFNIKYYKKVKAVWKKENNESSLEPKIVTALFETENKKLNILNKKEQAVPLIKINKNDQGLGIQKKENHEVGLKEKKPIIVSTATFQKTVDPGTEFEFTSFVKNVSRKNKALPKYIRDNWTIVLSIRNQLENGN